MDGPSNTPRNAKGKEKEGSEGGGVRDAQSQLTDQRTADSNSFLSPQTVTSSRTSDNVSEPGSAFVPVDDLSRFPSPVAPITRQDDNLRLQPTSVVAETPLAEKQAPAPPPEPPTSIETSENETSTTAAIGTGLPSDNTTSGSSEPTGVNASTTAAAAAPAATTRPFPPPGTLVVVQGVVHTTDVPRSNAPSTNVGPSADASMDHSGTQPSRSPSQDRNGPSARSRLSTILRPRSAGPASGTHDSGFPDDAAQITLGNQQSDGADLHIDETIGSAETSTFTSQEAAGTDEPTATGNESSHTTLVGAQHNEGRENVPGEVEQRNIDDANGSGPISSSSIDVLGTLLR